MKQLHFIFTATAMMALLGISLSSCSKDDGPEMDNERVDIVLTKSQEEILEKGNSFAFDFFHASNEKDGVDNKCLSPLSLNIALMMLANGAKAQTRDNIIESLGLQGYGIEDVNNSYKTLLEGLLSSDKMVTMRSANSVWSEEPFLPDFEKTMEAVYEAPANYVDFRDPETLKTINEWCSKATDGHIDDVTSDISTLNIRALLINAIFFKGSWTSKFDKSKTDKTDFTGIDGQKSKVEMMSQTNKFQYVSGDELYCELPFGNEAFSMHFIMPSDKNEDFSEFVQSLTIDKIKALAKSAGGVELDVSIPKMEISYKAPDLRETLKTMGLDLAMSEEADYTNMFASNTAVGQCLQKTTLDVDEDGATGSATTVVTMYSGVGDYTPTGSFIADRPFVYYITEKSTGAILLIGTKVR